MYTPAMKTTPLLVLLLAGCCSPDLTPPPPTGTPADAVLVANPSSVTMADLETVAGQLETHYWAHAQWEGVIFEPFRSDPALAEADGFGLGGDSALFTGFALAAHSFQVADSGDPADLARALKCLRGLWYVTHAAGPGVIARCAFPKPEAARWDYPARWAGRLPRRAKFIGETPAAVAGPPLPGALGDPFPQSVYYTRATKDQLTGILFGLSVAWVLVPESQDTVRAIMVDLAAHLDTYDWRIRDANGKNDTSSDLVSGLLKVQFLALWRLTSGDPAVTDDYLATFQGADIADWFNLFNNYEQYYAHNLRATRAFTVWLLEDDATRKSEMRSYYRDHVWAYVSGHQNAWFAVMRGVQARGVDQASAVLVAQRSLAALSLKPMRGWWSPYGGQENTPTLGAHLTGCADAFVLAPHLRKPTEYWTWQKEPWDIGHGPASPAAPPVEDDTGLSFLLPYWMGRYYGLW